MPRTSGSMLDSFAQYDALLILGPDAEPLMWVGSDFALPDALIQAELSAVEERHLTNAIDIGSEIIQLASARLGSVGSQRPGTLHAVLRLEAVGRVLETDQLSEFGEIFLLDESGAYLAASAERMRAGTWTSPTLHTGDRAVVVDYSDYEGERVVGSSRPVERFGWILAVEEPYNEAFLPVVHGIRRGYCVIPFTTRL